jgi:hypothetical protein
MWKVLFSNFLLRLAIRTGLCDGLPKKIPVRKVIVQIVWRVSTLSFEAGVCRLRRANHLTAAFGKFVNYNSVTIQTI